MKKKGKPPSPAKAEKPTTPVNYDSLAILEATFQEAKDSPAGIENIPLNLRKLGLRLLELFAQTGQRDLDAQGRTLSDLLAPPPARLACDSPNRENFRQAYQDAHINPSSPEMSGLKHDLEHAIGADHAAAIMERLLAPWQKLSIFENYFADQGCLTWAEAEQSRKPFEPPLEQWRAKYFEIMSEFSRIGTYALQEANRIENDRVEADMPEGRAESECKHSADFTSCTWYGDKHTFTKQQAHAIRLLWEEWEKGDLTLGQEFIGEQIGSSNEKFRMSHLFRKGKKQHAAWRTMIQSGEKGTFKLGEPPKQKRNPKKK